MWFSEGCSKLLDQRKQGRLQLLQDPSEINGDNQNDVRCEASGYLGKKRGNILKTKLMSLQRTVRTRTGEKCIEV
jgi:hypothetical protein